MEYVEFGYGPWNGIIDTDDEVAESNLVTAEEGEPMIPSPMTSLHTFAPCDVSPIFPRRFGKGTVIEVVFEPSLLWTEIVPGVTVAIKGTSLGIRSTSE